MKKLVLIGAVLAALTIVPAAGARTPEPATPTAVRHAYASWLTALRHSDGYSACARMTPHARRLISEAVREQLYLDMSCKAAFDLFGHRFWASLESRTLHGIVIHGDRASATTNAGSHAVFRRRGIWRYNGG